MNQRVKNVVYRLIAREFGVEEVSLRPEATLLSYGPDSLDVVAVVLGLEVEFTLDIPDEDVTKMTTVQDVVDYIARRMAT